MPNGIIPDEGLDRALFRILVNDDTATWPWLALLWVNDYTPDNTTTLADLVEASYPGYSRRTLQKDTWTAPATTGSKSRATYGTTPLAWTNGSGGDVTHYGYAILDPLFNVLRLVERFEAGDIRAVASGEVFQLLPEFSFRSQTPTE